MNLNPFDWRGPEFLGFYAALSAVTIWGVWLLRRHQERGEPGSEIEVARELAEDPYQIAFLRGGRYEVLNVAVVSLLERGLLQAEGEYLSAAHDAAERVSHPLDKAVLTRFTRRQPTSKGSKGNLIYTDSAILAEADVIGTGLQERKLLPDSRMKAHRKGLITLAVAFLWLVAGIKIMVAISRGRTNFGFLVLLAAVTPFLILLVSRRFRTALGDKTYDWVQAFFANLRSRRDAYDLNSAGSELTFLAAAFGLAAMPAVVNDVITPLHLKPPKPVASASSSGCGSGCASFSSSCGSSSGGGGCGGGGCGGGGCGGCGS